MPEGRAASLFPPGRGVASAEALSHRSCGCMVGPLVALADTARFHATDPDPLVSASLACPICLHSEDIEWEASLDGYDPAVQCRCAQCDQRWQVYLAPQQALRFGLMATRTG